MYSLNFLYYSLGAGFLILVGFLCYAIYYLAQDLKKINEILDEIEDVSSAVDLVGSRIKLSILNLAQRFLTKGGDKKNGKK